MDNEMDIVETRQKDIGRMVVVVELAQIVADVETVDFVIFPTLPLPFAIFANIETVCAIRIPLLTFLQECGTMLCDLHMLQLLALGLNVQAFPMQLSKYLQNRLLESFIFSYVQLIQPETYEL